RNGSPLATTLVVCMCFAAEDGTTNKQSTDFCSIPRPLGQLLRVSDYQRPPGLRQEKRASATADYDDVPCAKLRHHHRPPR
ncbi:hypothetical protein JTB14_017800, partial [Gonioctena quinquepunctata]